MTVSALYNLSIIIVTWNGDELLESCLKSLRVACGLAPEIVVVDNANLQSTQDLVSRFENAKYVASKENLGFAGGNNLGLKYCSRPYILLLNNDTIVHQEPFSQMIRYLKDNPRVAVVQGKMRLARQGDILDECGSYLTNWGELYLRFLHAPVSAKISSGPIFHAKGACMMFHHSILDELDGVLFYDRFKSYYEDVDFCHRVWLSGREVHFVDTPPIDHLAGATGARLSADAIIGQTCENKMFSFLTVLGGWGLMTILPRQLLLQSLVCVRHVLGCNITAARIFARGLFLPFSSCGDLLRVRKGLQARRRASDARIFEKVVRRLPWSFYWHSLRGRSASVLVRIDEYEH